LTINGATYVATEEQIRSIRNYSSPLTTRIKTLARIVKLDLLDGCLGTVKGLKQWDPVFIEALVKFAVKNCFTYMNEATFRSALSNTASQVRAEARRVKARLESSITDSAPPQKRRKKDDTESSASQEPNQTESESGGSRGPSPSSSAMNA
jgi:hypothetical protein